MEKREVKIKNWSVLGKCLTGEVENHPNIPFGAFVRTSEIIKIETRNTIYIPEGLCKYPVGENKTDETTQVTEV